MGAGLGAGFGPASVGSGSGFAAWCGRQTWHTQCWPRRDQCRFPGYDMTSPLRRDWRGDTHSSGAGKDRGGSLDERARRGHPSCRASGRWPSWGVVGPDWCGRCSMRKPHRSAGGAGGGVSHRLKVRVGIAHRQRRWKRPVSVPTAEPWPLDVNEMGSAQGLSQPQCRSFIDTSPVGPRSRVHGRPSRPMNFLTSGKC